jgi:type VI secretion system protein
LARFDIASQGGAFLARGVPETPREGHGMTVRLRFQSTGAVPNSGEPILMRGASMTIGRGPENDVVLPDPDRMVSKTHCVVEDQNGRVVIVDLSSNGTFLNYGKVPLGKAPTNLNPGDILTIGPYELVVEITADRDPLSLDPLSDAPVSHGRADRAPDPFALLEDAGPGGDFLDDLLGPDKAPRGPRQFKTDEDPFDQLLAPLGASEDPFFGGAAPADPGFTQRDHSTSASDAFLAPRTQKPLIPDEWDDLLDLGKPDPAPPFAAPAPTAPPPRAPEAVSPPPRPVNVPPPVAAPPPPLDTSPFDGPPAGAADADPFSPDPAPAGAAPLDPFITTPPVRPTPGTQRPAAHPPPAAPAAPAAEASGGDGTAMARAFLAALGAAEVRIDDADLPETMQRLGRVLNRMVTGIREILMTRTSMKEEFRIERTMINAAGNNPLKFSVTPEQAIEAMAKPQARGYLPAEQATEQALQDIRAHEIAMMTGMEAALKGILRRLDPRQLEERIAQKGGVGFLQNRKAKYWETYEEMYAEISDQAENQFHELFSREFAAAYKAQLERLK